MMHSARLQQGNVLFVSLVMLLLLSLFAFSAFNSSTGGARIVSNTQVRQEAMASAQQAIENTISSTLFSTQSAAVAAAPIKVDVNGDGIIDYTAVISPAPKCYRRSVVKTAELDPSVVIDLPCFKSSSVQGSGIFSDTGAVTAGDSLCGQTEWSIRAEVSDPKSNTKVALNQGVALRALVTDAIKICL